jgi:Ca2+-transporting ATPase
MQGLSVLLAAVLIYLGALAMGRDDDEIRTITFVYLILANVFLILTNRSWTMPTIQILRKRKNPTVKWIVGLALLLLVIIVEIPIAREAFNLGPISWLDWVVLITISYLCIAWFDAYKALRFRNEN